MSNSNDERGGGQRGRQDETSASAAPESQPVKKSFVEPELSSPIDVLEVTTLFQNNVETIGPLP